MSCLRPSQPSAETPSHCQDGTPSVSAGLKALAQSGEDAELTAADDSDDEYVSAARRNLQDWVSCSPPSEWSTTASSSDILDKASPAQSLPPCDDTRQKRRRLRQKQACHLFPTVCSANGYKVTCGLLPEGAHSEAGAVSQSVQESVLALQQDAMEEIRLPSLATYLLWPVKRRGHYVYDCVRNWFHKAINGGHDLTAVLGDVTELDASAGDARKHFSALAPSTKASVAGEYLANFDVPDWFKIEVRKQFSTDAQRCKNKGGETVGTSMLLTYIGPWKMSMSADGLDLPSWAGMNVVCKELRENGYVRKLWSDFQAHIKQVLLLTRGVDYAACLEVCPETLELTASVQLHFHLYIRSNRKMFIADMASLSFQSAKPNRAHIIGGAVLERRARHSWSGYFYCCVDKIGSVERVSNRQPFKDFSVNANWIMQLVQAQKLTVSTARDLLVDTGSGVGRCFRELDIMEAYHERRAYRHAYETAMLELAKTQVPFKTYPVVTEWLAQYSSALHRYKCLVLTGPSRMGKTAFARSLKEVGTEYLELNCSANTDPDLRSFRWSLHSLIIFDEITPSQVANQRKLFQASATPIDLGTSSTQMYSYKVYVHRKRMVFCSNNWQAAVSMLPHEAGEWVHANTFVLQVNEPMWDASAVSPPTLPL